MLNVRPDFLPAVILRAAAAIPMPMPAAAAAANGGNVLRLSSAVPRFGISGKPDVFPVSIFSFWPEEAGADAVGLADRGSLAVVSVGGSFSVSAAVSVWLLFFVSVAAVLAGVFCSAGAFAGSCVATGYCM